MPNLLLYMMIVHKWHSLCDLQKPIQFNLNVNLLWVLFEIRKNVPLWSSFKYYVAIFLFLVCANHLNYVRMRPLLPEPLQDFYFLAPCLYTCRVTVAKSFDCYLRAQVLPQIHIGVGATSNPMILVKEYSLCLNFYIEQLVFGQLWTVFGYNLFDFCY